MSFDGYDTGPFYDEMLEGSGTAHPQYAAVRDCFAAYSNGDLAEKQAAIDRAFLEHGITFTVYSDQRGTERIFPFDPFPRVLSADEWPTVERGLVQRITALNLFLHDIYHDAQIVAEHVISSAAHYVSGYVWDPGRDDGQEVMRGAQASHAWAEVFVPGHEWTGLDPTNNKVVNDEYVIVAIGRDYGDIAPVQGSFYGGGPHRSTLIHVEVRKAGRDALTA